MRNLLLGCRTFGELLGGAPGIPRSVLSERLRQLEQHGIVRRREQPVGRGWLYEPTEACEALRPVCDALGVWGATWVEMTPEHLDPYVALWGMCRGLRSVTLPQKRVTLRFEFHDMPRSQRLFWLLVQRPEPEVCVKPPGFDEDLVVRTDSEWLARWVQGQASLGHGMRERRVQVDGPRALVSDLRDWGEYGARALRAWGDVPAA